MQTPPDAPSGRIVYGKIRRETVLEAWDILRENFAPWVFGIVLLMITGLTVNIIASLFIDGLSRPSTETLQLRDLLEPQRLKITFFASIVNGALVTIVEGGILGAALMRLRATDKTPGPVPVLKIDGTAMQLAAFGVMYAIIMFLLQTVIEYAAVIMIGLKESEFIRFIEAMLAGGGAFILLLYVSVSMFLVPVLIVDKKLEVLPAVWQSMKAITRQLIPAVNTIVPTMIVAVCGIILCLMGIVYTLPILFIAKAIIYRDVFEPPRPPATVEFDL